MASPKFFNHNVFVFFSHTLTTVSCCFGLSKQCLNHTFNMIFHHSWFYKINHALTLSVLLSHLTRFFALTDAETHPIQWKQHTPILPFQLPLKYTTKMAITQKYPRLCYQSLQCINPFSVNFTREILKTRILLRITVTRVFLLILFFPKNKLIEKGSDWDDRMYPSNIDEVAEIVDDAGDIAFNSLQQRLLLLNCGSSSRCSGSATAAAATHSCWSTFVHSPTTIHKPQVEAFSLLPLPVSIQRSEFVIAVTQIQLLC